MGRRPKWGRAIDGVFILNKDDGMTSNDALQQVKRLFFAKRAGHTGSLDPLATGVLPICLGEATKFSQYLLDADKTYRSTFRLGISTETGDCDGEEVKRVDASAITQTQIQDVLPQFTGEIEQIPSMYSALKYQGKPLYKWAREGITLPPEARQSRKITVYRYDVLDFRGGQYPEVDVEVACSKGTYIRTLAEDLGQLLGVGAHVIKLHRTEAGPFKIDDSMGLEQLQSLRGEQEPEVLDKQMMPMDMPVLHMPKVELTSDMKHYFCQGQAVMNSDAYRSAKEGDMVRVYVEDGKFLGVACLNEGNVAPKRIVIES